jgi:hypothetical protein
MTKRHTALTLAVAAALALSISAAPAPATAPPLATGSGHTIVDGELRTFSFTARQEPDGVVRGTAQIHNRAIDEMFTIDVDCLVVAGNIAVMSGVVSRHTDEHAVGLTGIFGVLDAGAGSAAADAVSQVFFFRPDTVTCRDIDPAGSVDLGVPIVAGNVQVH